DRRLAVQLQVRVALEQVLQDELVRGAARHADERIAIGDDLFRTAVVGGGEARRAERGERIGGDHGRIRLADQDDGGHRRARRRAPAMRRRSANASSIHVESVGMPVVPMPGPPWSTMDPFAARSSSPAPPSTSVSVATLPEIVAAKMYQPGAG